MFEKATRRKYRFDYKGICVTEDLWDIPLKDVDVMHRNLKSIQTREGEESLLSKTRTDEDLSCKIAILRYVVLTRLEEIQARSKASEKRARKKHLLDIIADKQDANLRDMSIEELTKLVDGL